MTDETARQIMIDGGLEPLDPYIGSGERWRCRCLKCGSEVTSTIDQVRQGSGCFYCGREKLYDALRTPDQEAISTMYEAGYEPLEPYPGQKDAPWRCRCLNCAREMAPTLGNVRQGKTCAWCAGLRVDPEEAAEVMRSLGAEPLEPYPGTNVPWRCRCVNCGNEITPRYVNARKYSPCRYCAANPFSYTDPAIVYLIAHDDFEALKVGIASETSKSDRVAQHRRNGWRVIYEWRVLTGAQAATIELEVLHWWRKELQAPIAVMPYEMPQGGFSETVSALRIDVATAMDKIDGAVARLRETPDTEQPRDDEVESLMKDG